MVKTKLGLQLWCRAAFVHIAVPVFALASASLGAATLNITTEDSPPYNMAEGGKVIGISTDKVRAMMARTAIDYTIELVPWRRAYGSALRLPDTCVYSTTRTPEREMLFKWVGPVASSEWTLYGLSDRKFKLAKLEDAQNLRIGTYSGDVRDAFLRSRGYKVDTAREDVQNLAMLTAGRIDLWASGKYEGNAMILSHGLAGKIVPVLTFNKAELYLACNRSVSDTLIERMNASLATMERDGSAKAYEQKYERWPQP
jgi:polar amino acid transport system substrate-binding protein